MNKLDESLLTGMPPFSKLDRRQIREILDRAIPHRFQTGETVFHEGDPAERFYLALDGIIRVTSMTAEGEHVILLHIPSGQLFGIAKALGRSHYPATAIAADETIALSWPTLLWSDFCDRYPGFATESYAAIGDRLGLMRAEVKELATQQVEQRVANVLLRLINQAGRKVADGIEVSFPITRQDLSEMTGTTLHTVSRLLSAWERAGIVESRRKHVLVRDPHRLVLLSEPKAT